jgi:hypothetical protein
MEAIVIILVLLLFGPLALVAGADTTDRNPRRRQAWWPGERGPR